MTDRLAMMRGVLVVSTAFVLWIVELAPPLSLPSRTPIIGGPGGVALSPAAIYLYAWAFGLYVGGVAALEVLRRRTALGPRSTSSLLAGAAGFVVGAKLQYQLETLPIAEVLALPQSLPTPGLRLPLGILLGSCVACGTAVALGVSWRAMGDAYAVASAATVPIGRIGCLVFGCCMGPICGRWLAPLCPTFPPGSEAYENQLQAHLIGLSASSSLPAHPLPLYFGAASIGTLIVLLVMLRRGAPPGSLLLAYAILWPAASLALEPLRAVPRPPRLMVGIPATELLVGLAVFACGGRAAAGSRILDQRTRRSRRRKNLIRQWTD